MSIEGELNAPNGIERIFASSKLDALLEACREEAQPGP